MLNPCVPNFNRKVRKDNYAKNAKATRSLRHKLSTNRLGDTFHALPMSVIPLV